MADFVFKISPNIVLGAYAASRLGQFVHTWGTRYQVIIDPVLKDFKVADKIEQALSNRNIEFFMFDDIPSSPDTETVAKALELARKAHVHGILAVGGMKATSVGRAVASLYNESHSVYDYVEGAKPTTAPLPLVCMPTTFREPFLFVDSSPITDARSRKAEMLHYQSGLCKLAIFDPNLLVSLTENQIASMALHTLCLACESYISAKATFFSDTIAEKAIELLGWGMDGSPSISTSKSKDQFLLEGGCMASLASACSSVGIATLLSGAIHSRYRISRSLVSAILFPYMLEDAAKYKTQKIAKAARLLGVVSGNSDDEAVAASFAENIRNRLALANLPTRLKDLSISVEELALAAEDAADLEYINFMPRSMTADDCFDLIKQAY